MEFLRGFLGNDSFFGRIMYRLGVVVITNVLFILCSIPIVTIGASLSGMYYVCLRARRDKCQGNVRIVRTFFQGFKENFVQATAGWLVMLLAAAVLLLEISWCNQFTAPVSYFKYGLIGLLVLDAIAFMYYFPAISAFKGTLKQHMANTAFFAFSRPHCLIAVAALHVGPVVASYLNLQFLPLAAFLWALCGFGLIAWLCSFFHLRQYVPFLAELDAAGDPVSEDQLDGELMMQDESEEKTLAEMRKFGL